MILRLCVLGMLSAAAAAQVHVPKRGVLESPGGDLPFVLTSVFQPYKIFHGDHWQRLQLTQDRSADPRTYVFAPYDAVLLVDELQEPDESGATHLGFWRKVGPKGAVEMSFRWEPLKKLKASVDAETTTYGPLFAIAGEPWDPTGRWRVQFEKDAQPAVMILEPSRNEWVHGPGEVQGTILTTTGDYRWLAGTARGDELRLSCFDGAHAFLFIAKRQKDGSLTGTFWSGASWQETWVARRDEKAKLPDAFTLTKARPDVVVGDLTFPDAETAEPRRLDALFGQVTLVALFGTWCPNCSDAGPFLRELQRRYGDRGLRVVGLAFEHGDDARLQRQRIEQYRRAHGATWPILLAGPSDKERASAAFPAIDAVRAFPTTLFIDNEGVVRAVHQGFSGPATGEGYEQQKQTFESMIGRLLGAAEAAPKKR